MRLRAMLNILSSVLAAGRRSKGAETDGEPLWSAASAAQVGKPSRPDAQQERYGSSNGLAGGVTLVAVSQPDGGLRQSWRDKGR